MFGWCPLKKSGFSFIFAKNSLAKKFVQRKFRPWSITKMPVQLSKKQTDPTNAFVEIEHQSKETQWAMGNVKSVYRNFEKKTFCFYENWQPNVWRQIQQQVARMNGILSVNAKTSAFCSEKTQKNTLCSLQNPKIEFFIAINSPKKFSRPLKTWNLISRKAVVWFLQNSKKTTYECQAKDN